MWQTDVSAKERYAVQGSLPAISANQTSSSAMDAPPSQTGPTQVQRLSRVPNCSDPEFNQLYLSLCKRRHEHQKQLTGACDDPGPGGPSIGEVIEHNIAYWFLKGKKSYRPDWCLSSEVLADNHCKRFQYPTEYHPADFTAQERGTSTEGLQQAHRSLAADQVSQRNATRPKWSTSRFGEFTQNIDLENQDRLDPLRALDVQESVPSDQASDSDYRNFASTIEQVAHQEEVVSPAIPKTNFGPYNRVMANSFANSSSPAAQKSPPQLELGYRRNNHEYI
jgi:hypothetical protein